MGADDLHMARQMRRHADDRADKADRQDEEPAEQVGAGGVAVGDEGVVGKDYLSDPFDQRKPKTHEFVLGITRELVTDLSLSIDGIYRFSGNQWEDDEVNLRWNETEERYEPR